MAISFITGKPGGGKGLLAMQQIVDELVKGERPIITNLAVQIEPWVNGAHQPMMGLRAYLLRDFKKDFDVRQRVHVVNDDDIAAFYLWRAVNGQIQKAEAVILKDRNGDEKVIEFDTSLGRQSGPVLYVVDEAWKFYGSRSWQKTGEGVLFYNAQHRKFGDDVLIVTQHTKQIDPAIHRVAQDFWVVTNHSKLSLGMFRQPDIFSVAIYDQAPTGAQLTPMSRKLFRLDKTGLAQTYDTSAGVGLTGRAVADIGARKKGLPWWGVLICVALAALVCLQFPKLIGWWVGHALSKTAVPRKTISPSASSSMNAPAPATTNVPAKDGDKHEPVMMTGYAFIPGHWLNPRQFRTAYWRVFLSDGRDFESGDGSLQKLTRKYCVIEGKRFELAHPLSSPELPPQRTAATNAEPIQPIEFPSQHTNIFRPPL
jgi:hypothetical protein